MARYQHQAVASLLLAILCWVVNPQVTRVVDGDTFDIMAAVWLNIVVTERVRVLNVDAWEMRQPQGEAARQFTIQWLADHRKLNLAVCQRDSFGRILAVVADDDGNTLADALKAAGMAKPGETR